MDGIRRVVGPYEGELKERERGRLPNLNERDGRDPERDKRKGVRKRDYFWVHVNSGSTVNEECPGFVCVEGSSEL